MSETDSGVAARHSSATVEHYSPPEIVEAAGAALGGIDLDPFSCAEANEVVRATYYMSEGGFRLPWHGRAFVNAPGGMVDNQGRAVIKASKGTPPCTFTVACGLPPGHEHDGCESSQKRAWQKLIAEYDAGRVTSAVFVCFSVELLQTTQIKPTGAIPLDFPICYPSKRIAYRKPGGSVGGSPPRSSCIICVPPRSPPGEGSYVVSNFCAAFKPMGKVVVPS